MDLTEFRGKQLYRLFALPVAASIATANVSQVKKAFRHLVKENRGLTKVVLKSQIPIGHRGKKGAVLFANRSNFEVRAKKLFGSVFEGFKVKRLLVEQFVPLKQELYLALMLDRQDREIKLLFSEMGGVDIEQMSNQDKLLSLSLPLSAEEWDNLLRRIPDGAHQQLKDIVVNLEKLMHAKDATLVEVNPLGLTSDYRLFLLDSKIVIDDNALFRQPELAKLKVPGSGLEQLAHKEGLAFVGLGGSIGVIGNGAGLVMATLDLVKAKGGAAANFLDVGGGARQGVMEKALDLVMQQKGLKGLFINIFGGITRADEIAKGLIDYRKNHELDLPIVVRLIGNHAVEGKKILNRAGIFALDSMEEAADLIVKKVK